MVWSALREALPTPTCLLQMAPMPLTGGGPTRLLIHGGIAGERTTAHVGPVGILEITGNAPAYTSTWISPSEADGFEGLAQLPPRYGHCLLAIGGEEAGEVTEVVTFGGMSSMAGGFAPDQGVVRVRLAADGPAGGAATC